jgi:hypothetical protein
MTGWDGTSALPNGTNLVHRIIDRLSPHVIASVCVWFTSTMKFAIYIMHEYTELDLPSGSSLLTIYLQLLLSSFTLDIYLSI